MIRQKFYCFRQYKWLCTTPWDSASGDESYFITCIIGIVFQCYKHSNRSWLVTQNTYSFYELLRQVSCTFIMPIFQFVSKTEARYSLASEKKLKIRFSRTVSGILSVCCLVRQEVYILHTPCLQNAFIVFENVPELLFKSFRTVGLLNIAFYIIAIIQYVVGVVVLVSTVKLSQLFRNG